MKTITNFLFLLVAAVCFVACEKDGDKIYLNSIEAGDLMASESEVVLSQDNSKDIVLSLAWTRDNLAVSDPNVSTPDLITMTLQASTASDFSSAVVESVETSLSKVYTGADLNTVAVTPYTIDMSVGYVLDTKQADTGLTLYSAASNGDYVGFMGVSGWYNYYLKEGDGTIWGNDGVTGTAFLMSSENDSDKRWNFWFPGRSGCYYVDVNTSKKVWSALYIPSLTVAGDVRPCECEVDAYFQCCASRKCKSESFRYRQTI